MTIGGARVGWRRTGLKNLLLSRPKGIVMNLLALMVLAQSSFVAGGSPPVRVPLERTTDMGACVKQLTHRTGQASERRGRIHIDGRRLGQLGYTVKNFIPADVTRRLELIVLGSRERLFLEFDDYNETPLEEQACWKIVHSWRSRFAADSLSTWHLLENDEGFAVVKTEYLGGEGCDAGSELQEVWYARGNVRLRGQTQPSRLSPLLDLLDQAIEVAPRADETERTLFELSEDGKEALGAESRADHEAAREPSRYCGYYRRAQERTDVVASLRVEWPPCGAIFESAVERIVVEGVVTRDDIARVVLTSQRGRHEIDVDQDGRFVQLIELVPGANRVTIQPLIPAKGTSTGWGSPDMFTLVFYRVGD